MMSQFLTAVTSLALIGAGALGSADVRASDAIPMSQTKVTDGDSGGASNICRVDVIRSGKGGTVNTTRTVLTDNSCVCTVVTGPADDNGNAEDVVAAILRDRTCAASPVVGKAVSGVATSGGGRGVILPVLVGVVGAAGLAVALGAKSRAKSRG